MRSRPLSILSGLAALVAAGLLASCASPEVRSSCHERVNDCLAGCRTAGPLPRNMPVAVLGTYVDDRTGCERQCHDLCIGVVPQ